MNTIKIKKGQTVKIISDLHLHGNFGLSSHFYKDEELLSEIKGLVESSDLLIINGDLFETFYSSTLPTNEAYCEIVRDIVYNAYKKTFQFMFDNHKKILIMIGNHDYILNDYVNQWRIFGKDIDKVNIRKATTLEFEGEATPHRYLVYHGDEPFWASDTVFSKISKSVIAGFWWLVTNVIKGKILDSGFNYKINHAAKIFYKENLKQFRHYFNCEDYEGIILGHTHNPVLCRIAIGSFGRKKTYNYINTGFYNGLENYITTMVNDGPIAPTISQSYQYNSEKEPTKTKGKTFIDWKSIGILDWFTKIL